MQRLRGGRNRGVAQVAGWRSSQNEVRKRARGGQQGQGTRAWGAAERSWGSVMWTLGSRGER